MTFGDYQPAPNQGARPDIYEIENRAVDPDGLVLDAMRELAPWAGKTLIDLGCGSGYWLPGYADEAAAVIGIEPDPGLMPLAAARDSRVRVLPGSAEHIPLDDASVDVVHARFAYFWPPNCSAGLAEVMRVLRPGGSLVVVDNDQRAGEFAGLLRSAAYFSSANITDAWWAKQGASRTEVLSRWEFGSRSDFEAVLRLEFPGPVAGGAAGLVADTWLTAHPDVLGLSYGYVLFGMKKVTGSGTTGRSE
jgi:SAM-dependent methyltransferase